MTVLAVLESKHAHRTTIEFEQRNLTDLAQSGRVDTYIVATEDGFSPLGTNRSFLARDLGIPEKEIRRLADWNRFENRSVSLVALASRRPESLLRGVVLAASETSECYKRYAAPRYGRPHRDFFYNVTYEAISYASSTWGARRFALSHLSGSGSFHEDIATCNAEALAHFCDTSPAATVDSLMFIGCCIDMGQLAGIARLNAEAGSGRHRPINTERVHQDGFDVINLDWSTSVGLAEAKT